MFFNDLCETFRKKTHLNKKVRTGYPNKIFDINQEKKMAVEELSQKITSPLVLTLPSENGPYTVDTSPVTYKVDAY